jgi:hypothetical protein
VGENGAGARWLRWTLANLGRGGLVVLNVHEARGSAYPDGMEDDLPDYTMCLPFPTLPEDIAARIQAAIAEFLRDQDEAGPPQS